MLILNCKRQTPTRPRLLRSRSARRGMLTVEVVILVAFSALLATGLYWLWGVATINGEVGGILQQLAKLVGELFKAMDNNAPVIY